MNRAGPLRRRTGLKRTAMRRRSPSRSSLDELVSSRRQVADRSRGCCEARCSGSCTGRYEHAHHRLLRSQGGSDDPGNLLAVCHACHMWIHDHPDEARRHGWYNPR